MPPLKSRACLLKVSPARLVAVARSELWHATIREGGGRSVITVEHLTKHYGRIAAVDDISFEVHKGEILGFLGPNGAGKTTTMRILTGYMPPTSGRATVAGYDVFKQSLEARRHVGYLPETVPLYPEMTPKRPDVNVCSRVTPPRCS